MNFRNLFRSLFFTLIVCYSTSCGNKKTEDSDLDAAAKIVTVLSNQFSSDSAYTFIEKQLSFGFRVTGSASSKRCGEWLYQKLRSYTDTAYLQQGEVTTYDKKNLPIMNIIGSFNPKSTKRILLASHWDSRPWADQDTKDPNQPIEAANDGASGVAVLLELARNLSQKKPDIGIDIVFFDAEDYGKSEFENSFCLGSQYWGKHLHVPNYKAHFGVLLDMVGGKNAQFMWESNSNQWGNFALYHVWGVAQELGYGNYFRQENIGQIIDDHLYVYQTTKIPMIDIIQYDPNSGFAPYWHTHNDNLSSVDKTTLRAVGHTLENVLFNPPNSIHY